MVKKIVVLVIIILAVVALAYFSGLKKESELLGTAVLSWIANTEPDLEGYKIYYGASKRTGDCPPAGYSEKLDVGKTAMPEKPSYKLEKLEVGKTYYFSVTSYDTSGNESCFSAEMSKDIFNIPK